MSYELTLKLDPGRKLTQILRVVNHLTRKMETLMSDVSNLTQTVTELEAGFAALLTALDAAGVMQNNPAVAQAVSNIENVIGSMADETAKLGMPPTP